MPVDIQFDHPMTDGTNLPNTIDGKYTIGVGGAPVPVPPLPLPPSPDIYLIFVQGGTKIVTPADNISPPVMADGSAPGGSWSWSKSAHSGLLTAGATYKIIAIITHDDAGADQAIRRNITNT